MYSRVFVLLLVSCFSLNLQAQSPASATRECSLSSIQICALHIAQDEVGIVTAPAHLNATSLLWIAPFAAGTGFAIEKDADAIRKLGIDTKREDRFRKISDYAGLYGPLAATGAGYLFGSARHDNHLKETAVLAGEAMADAAILNTGLGYAINRQTPQQGDGTGRFWPHGTKTWPDGQSMPSDHSVLAWSFAHVVASQYDGIATRALVYSLAATVSASRVVAREHFPSDVIVGAGLGYVIGGYVLRRRSSDSPLRNLSFAPVRTANGRGLQIAYNFSH